MERANNCVLNSWQFGTAVRVVRSYRLLQSVIAKSFSSIFAVGTVASGRDTVSGFCHGILGSMSHAQYTRIQVSWSSVVAKAVASADNVLVTTRWIFFVPQDNGLTLQDLFLEISLWVAMMIIPEYDSGFVLDAKDASEKAKNLRSFTSIGLILMVTSWCFFAVWRVLLAIIRVVTFAVLIWDWSWLRELVRSGLVWTAAYCNDPMSPRKRCLSSSVTGSSSWALRSGLMVMGLMLRTYFDWESSMLLSWFCFRSIPVKVKTRDFLDPNGYLDSSLAICCWKKWSPPWMPSSTWIPRAPERFWFSGCRRINTHGSKGQGLNPRLMSSSCKVWNHKKGASMRPYADLSSLQISPCLRFIAFASSLVGSSPIIRSFWGFPWRNAALISNDPNDHPIDEISWRIIILDCLPNVGLSLGTSVICGSIYPNTTKRAFGLWVLSLLLSSLASVASPSSGFQVRIQRHLRICSGANFSRRIFETVPVFSQFWTSVSFAWANAFCSSLDNIDNFTSVLCFFSVVAIRRSSGDQSLKCSGSIQDGTSNSHFQAHGTSAGSTCMTSSSQQSKWVVIRLSSLAVSGIGTSTAGSPSGAELISGVWSVASGSVSGWSWDWLWLSSLWGCSGLLLGFDGVVMGIPLSSEITSGMLRFGAWGCGGLSSSNGIRLASEEQTGRTCSSALR